MATALEPGWIGSRLAKMRAKRHLTAAQLAQMLGDSSITKTVITNVESGRKRDLTVTELVQLASALDVSPMSLIVDTDDPWAPVSAPGLTAKYSRMSNIEYARATVIFGPDAVRRGGFDRESSAFLEQMVACEVALDAKEFLESEEDLSDGDSSWGLTTRYGETHWVNGGGDPDEKWWDVSQAAVTAYRGALNALESKTRYTTSSELRLSGTILDRFEFLRRSIVALIAEQPDLDFGRDDVVLWYSSDLPLDPATGRLISRPPYPQSPRSG